MKRSEKEWPGVFVLHYRHGKIKARSHVSARYRITLKKVSEPQSSSGVLVSTGAGSTGWLSSVFNMAAGVAAFAGGRGGGAMQLRWDDPRLVFVVREPFASRSSMASLVAGANRPLQIV